MKPINSILNGSRDSVVTEVTRLRGEDPGLDSRQEQAIFLSWEASRPPLGPIQSPIQ